MWTSARTTAFPLGGWGIGALRRGGFTRLGPLDLARYDTRPPPEHTAMKNTLLTLGWGLLTTSGALAGTFNLNSVKGLWPMAGTLDSRWPSQPGLSTQGLAEPVYVTSGATSWLALASDRPPYGGLTPEERLVVPNHSGPNGPAAATLSHSWTLVMDVRFPLLDNWTSLLQSNPDNTSDAVIFIDPSRQLRLLGGQRTGGGHRVRSVERQHLVPARLQCRL